MGSKDYFEEVATDWDSMRKGFFSERVRDKALCVAGVRDGGLAADLGAGTGFVTAGLLAKGLKVIAVDESPSMLEVLKKNVGDQGVDCRVGESERLPIDDGSLDYAFANMYLHHVEHPAKAIKEAYSKLKPGGVLVITDLDAHAFDYLRTEHNDRWMGFERASVASWYEEAGFQEVRVDCVGETCDSTSNCGGGDASISIFYAVGRKP